MPTSPSRPASPGAPLNDADAARRRRALHLGAGCALLVVAIWTGFILLSRAGVRGTLGPWDLAALRYTFAGTAMLPLLLLRGLGTLNLARSAVLALFAGLGFPLFAYAGFAFAPVAHAAVLMPGALPFSIAVCARLILGERIVGGRALGLTLILAGILMVAVHSFSGSQLPGSWKGDLLFLSASTSFAVYVALARKWSVHPLQATAVVSVIPMLAYLPIYAAFLPSSLAVTPWPEVLFQGVYQGVISVVVSLLAYNVALREFGPVRMGMITAIVPGAAALLAVPLLGEPLSLLALGGVAAVTVGMLVGVLAGARALATSPAGPDATPATAAAASTVPGSGDAR